MGWNRTNYDGIFLFIFESSKTAYPFRCYGYKLAFLGVLDYFDPFKFIEKAKIFDTHSIIYPRPTGKVGFFQFTLINQYLQDSHYDFSRERIAVSLRHILIPDWKRSR